MKFMDFIVSESIDPDIGAASKDDTIRTMVANLRTAGAVPASDEEAVISAILKREELGSTGIGNGVAVPHTKHPCVDRIVATVAISKNGVEFASLDGENVFILFLLISPPDRPGDHLRGLENISRHLRNQDFCSFLRQANSAEEIIELLKEADDEDGDD